MNSTQAWCLVQTLFMKIINNFVSVNIVGVLSSQPSVFLSKKGNKMLHFTVMVSQQNHKKITPVEFQVYFFLYSDTLSFLTEIKPGNKIHISGDLYVSKWKTLGNLEKTSLIVKAKTINLLK